MCICVNVFSSNSGFGELERVWKPLQSTPPPTPITSPPDMCTAPYSSHFPIQPLFPGMPASSSSPGKMAPSHLTDVATEAPGPEGDAGSACKSQDLVSGQIPALTPPPCISSSSSAYPHNKMPIQSPHTSIILFLFSFDSITFFFYPISPLVPLPFHFISNE